MDPAPRPSLRSSPLFFAFVSPVALVGVFCAEGCGTSSSSPADLDAGVTLDSASVADSAAVGLDAAPSDGTPLDAPPDVGQVADSEADSDAGSPSSDSAVADSGEDAGGPAADCLQAGSPPDGGDPASNSYMQSCGGPTAVTTTAANGNPCSIDVVGQHCFLECAFCYGNGVSPPSSLVLPCTQPITNCCGILTCGACEPCN
jgi:hypothetical protein